MTDTPRNDDAEQSEDAEAVAERREDAAAQAEEERLDRETPEALTTLSPTAQRFLEEPVIAEVNADDLRDDVRGDPPTRD